MSRIKRPVISLQELLKEALQEGMGEEERSVTMLLPDTIVMVDEKKTVVLTIHDQNKGKAAEG